jgi:SAM-dependent methyltransferase
VKFGFLYSHPLVYDAALHLLYKGNPLDRFAQVAGHVPEGSQIVDLCAGTTQLYRQLEDKDVDYRAIDINPRLVDHLRRAGVPAECADVGQLDFPEADVITMCSSLYHFHPRCEDVVRAMISRARHSVIILEPIRNAGGSHSSLMRWLGAQAGKVDGKSWEFYFTPETFEGLANSFPELEGLEEAGFGRDMIATFKGTAR